MTLFCCFICWLWTSKCRLVVILSYSTKDLFCIIAKKQLDCKCFPKLFRKAFLRNTLGNCFQLANTMSLRYLNLLRMGKGVMITSLVEMLELPNFGHMTTSTIKFASDDKICWWRQKQKLWPHNLFPNYLYFKKVWGSQFCWHL